MTSPQRVLRDAIDTIERRGWRQSEDEYGPSMYGDGPVTLCEAIDLAAGRTPGARFNRWGPMASQACRLLRGYFDEDFPGLMRFNNAEGRTVDEVLDLLRSGITPASSKVASR